MGKRGKKQRAEEKKRLRALEEKSGRTYKYRTYERGADGELKAPKMSKAEHRRRWCAAIEMRMQAEIEIVEAMCKKAMEDIWAIEDAKVFGVLEAAIAE